MALFSNNTHRPTQVDFHGNLGTSESYPEIQYKRLKQVSYRNETHMAFTTSHDVSSLSPLPPKNQRAMWYPLPPSSSSSTH
ncbi:hypothetical protein YC2023_062341 [Brassica napus]